MQEVLVPYASAQRLSNNNNYKIEDANHLTICQPRTKNHISYTKLVQILNLCLQVKHQLQMTMIFICIHYTMEMELIYIVCTKYCARFVIKSYTSNS